MKISFSILSTSLGIASAAADGNTTTNTNSIEGARLGFDCFPKPDGLGSWYYNSKAEGPYDCTLKHDGNNYWSMLNAYRSGGTEGVHWKYTDNVNDSECLKDWKYYSADGQTLLAQIPGRTTTVNDPRRWCPMPVYRQGGVFGKQWDRCICRPRTSKPGSLRQ